LEQAVQLGDQVRSVQLCAWFRTMLGEAYLLNGEIDKATGAADEALETSTTVEYLVGVGLSKLLLGRIANAEGNLVEAERLLNEALRIFTSLGARFDQGRTHLDLATLAHSAGNREAVGTHLKEAHDLFASLQVPKYIEQTQRYGDEFGV